MKYITENVRVVYMNMPTTIKAFVNLKDDYYTIVCNARLSKNIQDKAIQHELNHIKYNDFEKPCYSIAEWLNQ